MQRELHVVTKIKQDGDLVRVDLSCVGDLRPDDMPEWKPGEPQTGPAYHSTIVLPGKADALPQEFINKLGSDIRECIFSRMKRAL